MRNYIGFSIGTKLETSHSEWELDLISTHLGQYRGCYLDILPIHRNGDMLTSLLTIEYGYDGLSADVLSIIKGVKRIVRFVKGA